MLCIVIVILGYQSFKKTQKLPALLIGISFAFFALSHILTIANPEGALLNTVLIIRTIAYLLVVIALFLMVREER